MRLKGIAFCWVQMVQFTLMGMQELTGAKKMCLRVPNEEGLLSVQGAARSRGTMPSSFADAFVLFCNFCLSSHADVYQWLVSTNCRHPNPHGGERRALAEPENCACRWSSTCQHAGGRHYIVERHVSG